MEDFLKSYSIGLKPSYNNEPEVCIFPHFRMKFAYNNILLDALRILIYTTDKTIGNNKSKAMS